MNTEYTFTRKGKDDLRKACISCPGWKQFAADNDIVGRKPLKDEMVAFAQIAGLNLDQFEQSSRSAPAAPAAPAVEAPAAPAVEAPAAPEAEVPAPSGDVSIPIDMITEAIGPVADILAPTYREALEQSVSDIIAKATGAAEARGRKAGEARAKANAPKIAGAMITSGATPADRICEDRLSKLFGITGAHGSKTIAIYNDPEAPAIDPDYQFDNRATALLATAAAQAAYVWLNGPKGSGKSTLPREIAARTGRGFVDIGFNRWTEPQALIGSRDMANGTTYWTDGAFTAAIRRPGCVIVLDELDKAPAATTAFLQTILAAQSLIIPETGERVDFAPDLLIVATANTAGSGDETGLYVSSIEQDSALCDRFLAMFTLDYMPEKQEIALLAKRTGFGPDYVKPFAEFATRIRQAVKSGETGEPVSHRALLAWIKLAAAGFNNRDAFEMAVQDKMRPAFGQYAREQFNAHFPAQAIAAIQGNADPVSDAPASAAPGTIGPVDPEAVALDI